MAYSPGPGSVSLKLPARSDEPATAPWSDPRNSTRAPSTPAPVSSTTLPLMATWALSRHGNIPNSSAGSKRMDPCRPEPPSGAAEHIQNTPMRVKRRRQAEKTGGKLADPAGVYNLLSLHPEDFHFALGSD